MDFKLICASLYLCLILNSTAKDPNLSKGTFTFTSKETGYIVAFNGGIGSKSSLPNPDLEQDDVVHGRI